MADAIARLDLPGDAPLAEGAAPLAHGPNSSPQARVPLGHLLRDAGLLTDAQLESALREGASTGERLGEVVVRRGWASEEDVAKLLAEQWQLGYVERASIWFDADALSRMTREQAQRLEALPTRVQDGRVVVAVAEPTEQRLADLRAVIGDETVVVVVPKTALDAGLHGELLDSEEPTVAPEKRSEPADSPVELPASVPPTVHAAFTPPPRAVASPRPDTDDDLDEMLRSLAEAAAEAASLQQGVGELSRRLERLSAGLATAVNDLQGAAADRAKVERLEEQLEHRTELTERLKSQLVDLTRTLEKLD
jgi:general secretion pathway protein E/type IV pilus assembly protein PilB